MGQASGKIQDRQFQMRVSDEFLKAVDKWRAKQEDEPSRADAIGRLVELGLTVRTERRPKSNSVKSRKNTKQRARELAGTAIDEMTDISASRDNQAKRKRRLISGPEEFLSVRRDRNRK